MKYTSYNHLHDFEFHDAVLILESYEDHQLTLTAEHLNLHKDAKQNPYDRDMEIQTARIIFQPWKLLSLETVPAYTTDKNGVRHIAEPKISYEGSTGEEIFLREAEKGICLHEVSFRKKNGKIILEFLFMGTKVFTLRGSCAEAMVQWDAYQGSAWYELRKRRSSHIILNTPTGKQLCPLHITYQLSDEIFSDRENPLSTVSLSVNYNGKDFYGNGKNYLWEDAFADLQLHLPEGVLIECCLTCRHGNMCPVGNKPGEVFCTKDFVPTRKSDLFYVTEDEKEREKRSKECSSHCGSYLPQSVDFFTYNDYLSELIKQGKKEWSLGI
jgi:hypothetical protein